MENLIFTQNNNTLVFYKKEENLNYSFKILNNNNLTDMLLASVNTKTVKFKNIEKYAVPAIFKKLKEILAGTANNRVTIFNKDNFLNHTQATFEWIENSTIGAKQKPDLITENDDEYFFIEEGVIRKSSYWGRIHSCNWEIKGDAGPNYTVKLLIAINGDALGFCKWEDFKRYLPTQKVEYNQ